MKNFTYCRNFTIGKETYSGGEKTMMKGFLQFQPTWKKRLVILLIKINIRISSRFWVDFGKSGKARTKETVTRFSKLFDNPLLKTESNAKSLLAKIYYNNSHIHYYRATGDYKTALAYTSKNLKLFMNVDKSIKINLINQYVSCLRSHLTTTLEIFDVKEFEKAIKELDALYKNPLIKHQLSSQEQVFYILYTVLMEFHTEKGDFEKAAGLINEVEAGLHKFKNLINNYDRLSFYYLISATYFGNSNYRKALPWLNKLLHEPLVRTDLQPMVRILTCLTHYEIGNLEVLEHFIKSTYHFLSKENRINKLEACMLQHIRKMPGLNSRKQLIDFYKELKDQLQQIIKDPLEKKFLEYFNIIYWIESKIEGKSFGEITKRNNKKIAPGKDILS
jgi:hypothetical protein